jgi:hypothetical protein
MQWVWMIKHYLLITNLYDMAENLKEKIKEANQKALDILLKAQPTWVDVMKAKEFIPDFKENLVLHAGPPIDPKNASVPFKNAVSGVAVHEGLAKDPEEAWNMILQKEILLGSQLDNRGASGAAYAITANSPVQIAENPETGKRGFCTFQEGPSRNVIRWGIYNQEVEDRLTWFDEVLYPALKEVIKSAGGVNLKNILAKATAMGDENHSRQLASTAILMQELMPVVMETNLPESTRKEVVKFLMSAERFFLHIFIAGAVSVMEGLKGIDHCTLQVAQGGNGYEFGTKFAFSGDNWYKANSPVCSGIYLNPEWDERHGVGYLGDSCVIETYGFGANAAIAGPMVVYLTGGDFNEARRRTNNAQEFCVGSHDWAPIPTLDMQGPPTGIDLRKVIGKNIEPICHGGMHHVNGGQAGAGYMNVPMKCFEQAIEAFGTKYNV